MINYKMLYCIFFAAVGFGWVNLRQLQLLSNNCGPDLKKATSTVWPLTVTTVMTVPLSNILACECLVCLYLVVAFTLAHNRNGLPT